MVGDGDGADIRHIRTPCGTQFGDGAVKRFGERFRFLARGAVDDAGFVRMAGDVRSATQDALSLRGMLMTSKYRLWSKPVIR